MEIGLNLFSIRTALQNGQDVLDTFKRLKDMGLSYVQYSGGIYEIETLQKASKILPIVLTHVPYNRIVNDTDKLIEEHKSFNCYNIGLGCFPGECLFEKEKCLDVIDQLEIAAEKMSQQGMKLFHHNHTGEFYRLFGNKRIFEMMAERAPHINFTLDTYWLQNSGVSAAEFIETLPRRVECIHLKDYKIDKNSRNELVPQFERVGYGNMNFHTIVEKAKAAGTKYFLIEQDDACEKENMWELIQNSIDYCRGEL